MKKCYCLKGSERFREVYNRGRRYSKEGIQLIVLKSKCGKRSEGTINNPATNNDIKIGISINRKYGNAVVRNRAKRQLRAICSELLPGMEEGFYIIIRPMDDFKNMEFYRSKTTVRSLLYQAGVLKR